MKTLISLLAVATIGLFTACNLLTEEQAATAVEGITKMVEQGVITREQGDAMIQAITGGGWSKALEVAAQIGGSVLSTLLALLGINKVKAVRAARAAPPK